jgi:hypothetical protein
MNNHPTPGCGVQTDVPVRSWRYVAGEAPAPPKAKESSHCVGGVIPDLRLATQSH